MKTKPDTNVVNASDVEIRLAINDALLIEGIVLRRQV
jgi:hypothetical protein